MNHGGHTPSITAPGVEAQWKVISSAYQDAQFSPDSVTYVEAHGTGTSLGDPIEIEIRGSALSLRKQEASGIQIEKVST